MIRIRNLGVLLQHGVVRFRFGISAALAFLTAAVLPDVLPYVQRRSMTNSVLTLVLFACLIPLFAYVIQCANRRAACCSIVVGGVYSVCMVLGVQVMVYDNVIFSDIALYGRMIALLPLFTAVVCLLLLKLPGLAGVQAHSPLLKKSCFVRRADWKFFVAIWVIVFICWIPYLLAAYPGVFRYDAPYQTNQIMVNGRLYAHHPVIHTLYLTGSLLLGDRLFGSYESGMAIYAVTQMLMLSAMFAYACYFLAKHKAPALVQWLGIAYFALMPFNGINAVTATKDTLFTGIFLLTVLFTAELVKAPAAFFHSRFQMIRYVAALVLLCMWRNNGVYIMAVFLPVLLIVFRRYWKRMLPVCLAFVVVYGLYAGPLMQVLNVIPGNSREALSVPMQQMVRAVNEHPEKLTQEEMDAIYEIIPEDRIDDYNSRLSDPVKAYFKTSQLMKEPFKYLRVYLSVGIKCPGTYVNAVLSLTLGNWYPDMQYPDEASTHQYIEYNDWGALFEQTRRSEKEIIPKRESKLPGLDEALNSYAISVTQQDVPVLSMLISTGMVFWLMLLAAAAVIYAKKYKLLIPLLLMFGLWGTLMLGPIVLFRYAYPLMVCTPFLFAVILACGQKSKQPGYGRRVEETLVETLPEQTDSAQE